MGNSSSLLDYNLSYAMENLNLVVYSIPGQNVFGGSTTYIQKILDTNAIPIIQVLTPTFLPDLGQFFCQRHLKKAIEKKQEILLSMQHRKAQQLY